MPWLICLLCANQINRWVNIRLGIWPNALNWSSRTPNPVVMFGFGLENSDTDDNNASHSLLLSSTKHFTWFCLTLAAHKMRFGFRWQVSCRLGRDPRLGLSSSKGLVLFLLCCFAFFTESFGKFVLITNIFMSPNWTVFLSSGPVAKC